MSVCGNNRAYIDRVSNWEKDTAPCEDRSSVVSCTAPKREDGRADIQRLRAAGHKAWPPDLGRRNRRQ